MRTQYVLAGDQKHALCVNDAFHGNKKMIGHIVDVMAAFPDKDPVTIIVVLMRQVCGK